LTRRRFLTLGVAGAGTLVVGGVGAFELAQRGVIPGKHVIDVLEGTCDVSRPQLRFSPLGPSFSKRFYSRARN
jgi:hypothetical protein